jgi:hypothetical protein
MIKKKVLNTKYAKSRSFTTASPFWKGLMQYNDIAQIGISWIVNKDIIVCFWLDRWTDNITLFHKYPRLFSISKYPQITISQIMTSDNLILTFIRQIVGIFYIEWCELV